jgi:hypothetical protein
MLTRFRSPVAGWLALKKQKIGKYLKKVDNARSENIKFIG